MKSGRYAGCFFFLILLCDLINSPLSFGQQETVEKAAGDSRPNIIFFMTDDQGYGDTGYMGHPDLKTPNIDAMARNGLRLDRFYASPVCSPTRASVLTGRHPNRSGTFSWGHALRPQEQTVIDHLSQAGYQTGFFGKWHLGSVRAGGPTSPGAHGFDEWVAAPNFYDNDPWMSRNGKPIQLQGESSAVVVNLALEFIEEAANKEAPFITFIWAGSPHLPHEASPEMQALYPGQPDTLRHYYGEMSGIDRALGHLRDRLRELDIAGETLLWFASDNGGRLPEASNGGLRGQKGELWEGGIRVPSILEWPGHIAPRVSPVPSAMVDLFPTVLELAGVTPGEQVNPKDGISLVPLIEGGAEERTKPLGFWHYGGITGGQRVRSDKIVKNLQRFLKGKIPKEALNEGRLNTPDQPYDQLDSLAGAAAWIEGSWKLHSRSDSAIALYNLENDPGEKHNLLKQQPGRAEQMREGLRAWQHSVINSIRGRDYQ